MSNKPETLHSIREEYRKLDAYDRAFKFDEFRDRCDKAGVDWWLICCTDQHFKTVTDKGNLKAF